MQQKQRSFIQKCKIALTGTAWVAGLLIAGSDSSYMPWPNGLGLLLFFSASILLGKQLGASKSVTVRISFPKINQKQGQPMIKNANSNQRIKTRRIKTRRIKTRRMKIRYAL